MSDTNVYGLYRGLAESREPETDNRVLVLKDLTEALETWDDLKFPASAINPPGTVGVPGRDTGDGCFLFDNVQTEILFCQAQMPHGWDEGTAVHPHVHWAKTTSAAGNVAWLLEYAIADVGGIFPAAFTSLGIKTTTVAGTPDTNEARKHLITALGPIDMTGYKLSCMIKFKLSRIGGDAGDTYAADAKMFEFDVHYLKDATGSTEEFTK